jgi:hypothetical protein
MSLAPFDGQFWIETAGLRECDLRLVHLTGERVSGGETPVRLVKPPAGVDRLLVFVDGGVDIPEAKLGVTQTVQPQTNSRIAWA